MSDFVPFVAGILVCLCLANAFGVVFKTGMTKDDTDLIVNGKVKTHSGLSIVTDYKTGVQYLFMPMVGMTPRLDAEGKPMRVAVDD